MKYIFGIIAICLTFIGYVPYLRDTIKQKTKPHIFSWFIWGLIAVMSFGIQFQGGAGPGAFVTLAAAIICFVICIIALLHIKTNQNIKKIDVIFFVLSIISLILWLVVKQPLYSIIILASVDLFGFLPTIRKSWNKPFEETLSSYIINTFRFGLAILALSSYSVVVSLYPIVCIFANAFISLYLIIRRKQIGQRA